MSNTASGQSGSGQTTSGSRNMMSGILVASGCNASSMQSAWGSGGMGDRAGNMGMGARSTASGSGSMDMSRTTNATAGRDMNAANTGNTGSGTGSTSATGGNMDRADNRSGSTTAGSADRAAAAGQTGTQPGDMNRSTVGDRSVNTPQTGMADRDRGGDTQSTAGGSGGDWRSHEWESGHTTTGSWDRACFISPTTSSFVLLTRDGRQARLDDASNQMIMQRLSSTNRVSQKSKIFRVRVNGDTTGDTIHITDIQM